MALKNLVADRAALTEEAIEQIVGDNVRYDLAGKEVLLTAEGAKLSKKAQVLIYLVALQGWRFVTQDAIADDARPIDIERTLDIGGNTLRPILKGLTEKRLIQSRGGRYAVALASLASIRTAIGGGD